MIKMTAKEALLSDIMLENLICSVCKKYLSIKPIKLYGNGIVKCGRCSRNSVDGTISMFEKLMEKVFFPCINRYEGCRKALRYHEVEEHEKFCPTTFHKCPICDTIDLSTYRLLMHFKCCHSGFVLQQPDLVIGDRPSFYIHSNGRNVFLLHIDPLSEYTLVGVTVVGSTQTARGISVKIVPHEKRDIISLLFSKDLYIVNVPFRKVANLKLHLVVEYLTMFSDSFIFAPDNYPRSYKFSIKGIFGALFRSSTRIDLHTTDSVASDIAKMFTKTQNLVCDICQQYFSDALCFNERSKSFTCGDCSFIDDSNIKCHETLTGLYATLAIYCKWGCRRYYNLVTYAFSKHEEYCPFRPFVVCPVGPCRFSGKMFFMHDHFELNHSKYRLTDETHFTFREILHMLSSSVTLRSTVYINTNCKLVCIIFEKHQIGEITEFIKCYAYFCNGLNHNKYAIVFWKYQGQMNRTYDDSELVRDEVKLLPSENIKILIKSKRK